MSKRVLIVDDEPAKIKLLETALRRSDFTDISSTTDARRALPAFREFKPDVLLIDLLMPQLDGLTIMQQLLSRLEAREYLPIIITTPNLTPEMRRRALEHGAKDFLPEPFDPDELPLRIRNLLQVRELNAQLETRVKS